MESVGEAAAVSTLRAHRGEVACADASGAWLATGGGDGALRLWRWRRDAGGWAEAAAEPRAHRYGLTTARWAPTGVLLATAGVDGAARIWAARTLACRGALVAPHAAGARAACWATGERLAVAHEDGAVRVWRVRGAALLACVRALEGSVHALAMLADATLMLAACTEGVLKVFSFEEVCNSGTEGGSAPAPIYWEDGAHDLGVLCADASACGRAAATGGQDARVRLWRVCGRRVAADGALGGHGAAVTALRWARGVALLASASLDRTARVWAVEARTCLRVLHAHTRYLTCVVVPQHARYLITGSNDKTIRTWSLSSFTADEDLEPECSPLVHFGLGDLEGIGPVDEDILLDEEEDSEASAGADGARCVWRSQDEHGGAINCIAANGNLLATASSDGSVKIFRWSEEDSVLWLEKTLEAHQYPVLSVDFGANGVLLLSAGLDGRACLWDVQTGCELASLWAAGAAGAAAGEGGGGVRGARVSPHRPPLLLLATDDGVAALWSIEGDGSDPVHVYGGLVEACTCCAWSGGGRAAAAGGAAGELRVLAPPPAARALWTEPAAHDLGVLSCDFAPDAEEGEGGEAWELLASGGMDEAVRLWLVELRTAGGELEVEVRLGCALAAHGGAVQSVRWGARDTLATAGADRWARVWRVAADPRAGAVRATQMCAVPAGGAGGAGAAALLRGALLAVGALSGRLALWRLPRASDVTHDAPDDAAPRWWGAAAVVRWLQEYVTRVPGTSVPASLEERLVAAVHEHALSGARLLDEPLDKLLDYFGCGTKDKVTSLDSGGETEEGSENISVPDEDEDMKRAAEAASRLREELQWLREPPLTYEEEAQVPHALRCALSHAALRAPRRASDGYTYEHAALQHWLLAAGAVSPVSGRRLRGAAALNRGALAAARRFLHELRAQR